MSKNREMEKQETGPRRQIEKESLMTAWLKEHRPDVLEAICQEVLKKYPYKIRLRKATRVLPDSLQKLK